MEAFKIISLSLFGLFLIDRAGLWLESKGLLYWRYKKSKSGAGNALVELNAMFNPGAKHQLELSQKVDVKERDDQGDDKNPPKIKFL